MANATSKSSTPGSGWHAAPGRYVIGAGPEADIKLSGEGIRPRHAILEVGSGATVISEINGSGGLCVNGKTVSKAQLRYGDVVQIGSRRFVMRPTPKSTPPSDSQTDIRRAAAKAKRKTTRTDKAHARTVSSVLAEAGGAVGQEMATAANATLVDLASVHRTHKAMKWQVRHLEQQNRNLAGQLKTLNELVGRLTDTAGANDKHCEQLGQYVRIAGDELQVSQELLHGQIETAQREQHHVQKMKDELQTRELKWTRKANEQRTSLEADRQRLVGAVRKVRARSRQQRQDRGRQQQTWRMLEQQSGHVERERHDLQQQRTALDEQVRELWQAKRDLNRWEREARDEQAKSHQVLAEQRQSLKMQEIELAVTLTELRKREIDMRARQRTLSVSEQSVRQTSEALSAQQRAYSRAAAQLGSRQRSLAVSELRSQKQHHDLTQKFNGLFQKWQKTMTDHLTQLGREQAGLEQAREKLVGVGQDVNGKLAAIGGQDPDMLAQVSNAVKDVGERVAAQHAMIDSELSRAEQTVEKVASAMARFEQVVPSGEDLRETVQEFSEQIRPLRAELEAHRKQLAVLATHEDEPAVLASPQADEERERAERAGGADAFELMEVLVDSRQLDRDKLRRVQRLRQQCSLPLGALGQITGLLSVSDVQRITGAQRRDTDLFGRVAVKLGLLTPVQVRQLLALQYQDGEDPLELLVDDGLISEDDVCQARHALSTRRAQAKPAHAAQEAA